MSSSVFSIDFSDKTPFTGPLPVIHGKLVACAQNSRLVVRNVESLTVVGLFSCLDRIEALAWSPTGEHILCGLYKRGTVQVFSLSDLDWHCTISDAIAGVVATRWCPSGAHILVTAEFQAKLSLWSLVDKSCTHLNNPKHTDAGMSFSPDGAMLAVLERTRCKDFMRVYDVATWQTISHVSLSTTDAADLSWSPDCSCLAVWDGMAQGPFIEILTASGERLAAYKGPGEYGLGLKCISWSPSGQLLALGGFEGDLAVLNHVTWSPFAWFVHPALIAGPADVVIYQEQIKPSTKPNRILTDASNKAARKTDRSNPQRHLGTQQQRQTSLPSPRGAASQPQPSSRRASPIKPMIVDARHPGAPKQQPTQRGKLLPTTSFHVIDTRTGDASDLVDDAEDDSQYVVANLPVKLSIPRAPLDRPNPKMGFGLGIWSANGAYLATRCDARPHVLWIWDTARLQLAAVLVHTAPIRAAAWAPAGSRVPRIAAVCGTRRLHVWTPKGASCASIPVAGMRANSLQWGDDGSTLAVVGKDYFSCAYFTGNGQVDFECPLDF